MVVEVVAIGDEPLGPAPGDVEMLGLIGVETDGAQRRDAEREGRGEQSERGVPLAGRDG